MCIRDRFYTPAIDKAFIAKASEYLVSTDFFSQGGKSVQLDICLLYTSDAADERSSVDLGGRRIIKKKKKQ